MNPDVCKICGGELHTVDCWSCGGKGGQDGDDLMEVDPLWYGPDDFKECDICDGVGHFDVCDHCANTSA